MNKATDIDVYRLNRAQWPGAIAEAAERIEAAMRAAMPAASRDMAIWMRNWIAGNGRDSAKEIDAALHSVNQGMGAAQFDVHYGVHRHRRTLGEAAERARVARKMHHIVQAALRFRKALVAERSPATDETTMFMQQTDVGMAVTAAIGVSK